MSEDLTGRRIGHYRIDGVLGRGGMSVMYRATDVRLGRKVALKVMGENLTGDNEFRERFVDEARNTSAIDHANVVPLYDFGEVDGLLYIAMRLVDGADLANLIKDGPLSPGPHAGAVGAGRRGPGHAARPRSGAPGREAGQRAGHHPRVRPASTSTWPTSA